MFARTIWRALFSALRKQEWTPTAHDTLRDWCVERTTAVYKPKELRAIFTLVLWELWKHRNAIVFDGATPSLEVVATRIVIEGRAWQQAHLIKGELDILFEMLLGWARRE